MHLLLPSSRLVPLQPRPSSHVRAEMALFTQAEAKRHLLLSTNRNARTHTYTDLLGFRRISGSRSRAGPQSYVGPVGDFYKATRTIAGELSKSYNSWNELHEQIEAQGNFTHQKIEELIGEYGPVIWNDGRTSSFLTVPDDDRQDHEDKPYPRHLIYNNQFDRARIRTFIYCLTLQRACREMRTMGPRVVDDVEIKMEPPHAASRSPTLEQTCVLPPDPDVIFISSNPRTNRPTPPVIGSTTYGDVGAYQVPVAQVAVQTHMEGISSTGVTPQTDADRVSAATTNDASTTEKSPQPSEMPIRSNLHTSTNQDSDVESDVELRCPSRKRRRCQPQEEAGTSFRKLQCIGSWGRIVALKRKGSSSGISLRPSPSGASPLVDCIRDIALSDTSADKTTHNNPDGTAPTIQPRDNIDTNRELDDNIAETSSVQEQQKHVTPSAEKGLGDGDNDVDSVQGSPRQSSAPLGSIFPPDEDEEPSLIVVLKIKNQKEVAQRRLYRKRLALKLPRAFEAWSQQTDALEDTVKLIGDIRAIDTNLPHTGFGSRDAPYQMILDQWLGLVNIYLRFRKEADFHDDLSAWEAYVNSLPYKERLEKRESLTAASVSLDEWRLEHPHLVVHTWSRDVTCILLEMTTQKGALKTEDVEVMKKVIMEFNLGVLSWFD